MRSNLAHNLGQAIKYLSEAGGVDAGRLRRHVAFERLLARLAESDLWVLKGGFCLEARLGTRARATKDLDVALLTAPAVASMLDVQDFLSAALEIDPTGDAFRFEVGLPAPISADEQGNPGWRATVHARVDGAHFASFKLDVVARPDEIAGGVGTLMLEPTLPGFRGHIAVAVRAVDVHQHAAEKLHAYCRTYGDRPSTRVKDLVDLVLLVESGVLNPASLGSRLHRVYAVRDATPPPAVLPPPPASWTTSYSAEATHLGLTASTTEAAWAIVATEYRRAVTTIDGESTR